MCMYFDLISNFAVWSWYLCTKKIGMFQRLIVHLSLNVCLLNSSELSNKRFARLRSTNCALRTWRRDAPCSLFFYSCSSWHNAFAEMLRFADRLFYRDWWNSTSFSGYYRTWNMLVHDWLYSYVYRDAYRLFRGDRTAAAAVVFLLSSVVHEYVITVALRFFYPVLFVMFMGAGFAFTFFRGRSRSWNIFLFWALFSGMGFLSCFYSMEWYARRNCPLPTEASLWLQLLPRTFTCGSRLTSSWSFVHGIILGVVRARAQVTCLLSVCVWGGGSVSVEYL